MTTYGFIYITTCNVNGKKYLGMCAYHRSNHSSYLGSGKALRRAIKKYGASQFSREIIKECATKEDMIQSEIELIIQYNCVEDRTWYNINGGGYATRGFSGKRHSPETKELMKQNHSRPMTEETIKKLSIAGKDRAKELHAYMREYYANGGVGGRAKSIVFEGIEYPSITACSKSTGYSRATISKRIAINLHDPEPELTCIE